MIKRVKLSGFIVSSRYYNIYVLESIADSNTITDILKNISLSPNEDSEVVVYDLTDIYHLYDRFKFLDNPLESMDEFLSSVTSLSQKMRQSILDGFSSYIQSIK
jgi:hypothetical protein